MKLKTELLQVGGAGKAVAPAGSPAFDLRAELVNSKGGDVLVDGRGGAVGLDGVERLPQAALPGVLLVAEPCTHVLALRIVNGPRAEVCRPVAGFVAAFDQVSGPHAGGRERADDLVESLFGFQGSVSIRAGCR